MTSPGRNALILGAATRIGAAMLGLLHEAGFSFAVLADLRERMEPLRALASLFNMSPQAAATVPMDPEKPFFDIGDDLMERLKEAPTAVFHLAHARDRTLPAATIRRRNSLMLERSVTIAHALGSVESLVVLTDAGLVGDYPGRFSEGWIDVGQTPFDEVDRSSLEAELACAKDKELPIVRARVGLVLDSRRVVNPDRFWTPPKQVLLPFAGVLAKLPSFLTLPLAIADGAMAPLTPADWAAEALIQLSRNKEASGSAVHLVIDSPPSMDELVQLMSRKIGGAKVRGGLPADIVAKLGIVPGMKELARRNADHLAAWWTPHRYCLSKNDLDTARLRELSSPGLCSPSWTGLREAMV